MSPFAILDHPADLGIEASGTTLAEAFEQAAAGLMSVILDVQTVEPRDVREVKLTAGDHEQLLVRWLSEVLYLYDGSSFVGAQFTITHLDTVSLSAKVRGEPFTEGKHTTRLDVKAVTYHQIAVEERSGKATIRVYLDI